MKIGDKIRQLRTLAGMTQEQLASNLGVSNQAVSKWENEVSMPDITLLPLIAEIFGTTIDELFDLTVEQKLNRIENRIEIENEFSDELFKEYVQFLNGLLESSTSRSRACSLLANLYHHRMESDSKIVSKYSRESILLDPSRKECQWLLNKAEGHAVWDWNYANHSKAIDFYKKVIESDKEKTQTSMPYYYLIDNLLADGRCLEAEKYLTDFAQLPSANRVMIDIYKAYITLGKYDVKKADEMIDGLVKDYPSDAGYLFEAAQYYARRCEYNKAIELYERAWNESKSPRYTDALQGIAIIYSILGYKEQAAKAYDRILLCLNEEWGYTSDDKPYIEVEKEKKTLCG